MEESVTYQAILLRGLQQGRQEGRQEEARAGVLRVGRRKFGAPSEPQETALRAITDLTRLESLQEKVFDVNTWDELLAQG